ncbi:MAG: DsbA family protein, partial [Candidatus Angelobacter sp.]
MRAILQTNSRGSVSRFFKATLPLALISTGLFLVGFPAPLNGQRALADAPSKTKSPLAKPALTSGAQARPRSISAPDWREELVRTPGAPVTIIEFFDYQCPYCLKTNPALEEAIRKRPGKVRLVLKHFPL